MQQWTKREYRVQWNTSTSVFVVNFKSYNNPEYLTYWAIQVQSLRFSLFRGIKERKITNETYMYECLIAFF